MNQLANLVRSLFLRRLGLAFLATALAVPSLPSELFGNWTLHIDPKEMEDGFKETRQLGSRWRRAVWVGNIPVPLPTGQTTLGNPDLKEPVITKCTDLTLSRQDAIVKLDCGEAGTYDYRVGEFRGRTVTVKKRKLTERYASTNRSVSTEYKLDKNGRMNVRVVLRMGKVKTEYRRIFDRASAATPDTEETPILESPGVDAKAASQLTPEVAQ